MYKEFMVILLLLCLQKVAHGCFGATLIRSGGLSCQDKHLIVDQHNRLRQLVALGQVRGQPPAANMIEMGWDEELARKAQDWANNCLFQHDSKQARSISRFHVGQNLAVTWSSPSPNALGPNPDFATQINDWFDEVVQHDFSRGFTVATGHYTQMVWSDTYLVGCGYSYFHTGTRYNKLYVCNYGPAGNIRGALSYRVGNPSCSLYGTSPSKHYYGLCEVKGILLNPCYYG